MGMAHAVAVNAPAPPLPARSPAPSERDGRELTAGGVAAAVISLVAMLLALRLRSGLAVGVVVTAAVFVPAERLLALRPRQRVLRRQALSDLVHLSVNSTLSNVAALVAVGALVATFHVAPGRALQGRVAAQPLLLQFLEVLLVSEVSQYWAHRATHAVPFLWRFHKVHHSIEEMDWLAAARLHPLDQAFLRACAILPVYALGFSRFAFGGLLFVLTLQAIFIHANVRINFGPLKYVIATPQYHHWHHSNEPGTLNRNFAGELPALDWLFGTLLLPRDNRFPSVYGSDERLPRTWAAQMVVPFRTASASAVLD